MDVLVLHWLKWITISVAVLIVVVLIAAFFGAEPLRQYIERSASEAVKGYHVRIGTLDLHPRTLSVDLRDVAVRREARPDPPLARYSGNRDRCSTDSFIGRKSGGGSSSLGRASSCGRCVHQTIRSVRP